ncbi:plasmid replication protein RepB [Thiolapillus sp.]|uniref:plasmid replication protein RepB n=2 Tax=Thiolapillus sp. TaxID=2017437 RepID=UPI0025EC181A|nr:plasmid replication protein RepB [Thiolapillus sp.]
MEIRLLRQLFQEGILLSATIVPAPMEPDRWLLVFDKSSGGQERITKARSDIDKVYKRINGAIADAEEIGFQEVKIRLK